MGAPVRNPSKPIPGEDWTLCAPREQGSARWRHWGTAFLDLLFPPLCPACSAPVGVAGGLCRSCYTGLPARPDSLCLRCGQDLGAPGDGCGHCLGLPWSPDGCHVAFPHQGTIREMILACKFADRPPLAGVLATLAWERLGRDLTWEAPDAVLPIPLHWRRLWQRRFNQSALVGGVWSRRLQKPLVTNALARIRMTPPQARLNREQRRTNLVRAFRADARLVAGRSLLLVDDVRTTGATLFAATAALKQAGARRVVWAVLAGRGRQPGVPDNVPR
ncbi:MAG: double zinc ribbon domain-containing protein [Magnetococcus sp. WYHC-3]